MSILKKIKDKTGTIHDLGDSRVDAFETELSGAEHNVPYSPAVLAKTNAIEASVSAHIGNTANPHKVTKAQIGLANVENKSSTQIRSELTKENVTTALGYTPIDESRIGAANGVASLDASGRIPASQIPGGFDNIEEYDNLAAFPTTGEEGKIYVAKDTNLTYRWTGSQYVEISPSLALGETATTAYRGDRGKVAYDHSQVSGNSTIHHTHANKELLDSYTQTEADLANAVAKVHEHGNKDVLDGITSDKVNSWDGKEDAFDVLPTTKGGTGTNAASKSELTSALINSLSLETSAPVDADYYVSQYAGGGNTTTSYHRRPVSALWDYIKGKISSVLKLTASDYAGKAATAGTADKAVADNSGNDIETTYAKKSELDNAVANVNMRYPFGVHQNRITSYGYRLFNVKFSTVQSATKVRISGNIVVGTTGNNEHISFDLVIANTKTVENNPSSIHLLTTSTRRGSRVVRLAYKRPSNWNDGLDVFILWNAEGTATAENDTYGWEITQQEATKPSGVEVKDENLTSALTDFTLDSPRTFAITEGTSEIGSTSVPVYANVNGVITPCTDDFVHDGDVTSTYSSTGTAPVNGTAVAAAINAKGIVIKEIGGENVICFE